MHFGFPVWTDMPYRPWQIDFALRIVESLGPKNVPLERQLLRGQNIDAIPLFAALRDRERLLSVSAFSEYQFDWPERIIMDMVLDAERMGAVCRNYTCVTNLSRCGEGLWTASLRDSVAEVSTASIQARMVLNTAGVWIDRVNAMGAENPGRKVLGTKGAHILIRLPSEFRDQGVIGLNRKLEEPIYLVPWREGLHYMAVTETVYDGDIDDVRADDTDVNWLIDEFNHLLPGLRIGKKDVLATWAGVRPLTYDPSHPKGSRSREIHDLERDGLPGIFAMTAGPLTTHRSAGRELMNIVAARLKPSEAPRTPSYEARAIGEDSTSPAFCNEGRIRQSDLRRSAETEHVTSLIDLLARRTGLVWTENCGRATVDRAAGEVADILGWDEARKSAEVDSYLAYIERYHWRPDV